MPGQFEKIEINNALTGDEAIAITALENTKAEDLTKALKDEKIRTSWWDKTITELADIFIECITVSADGKLTISEEDKQTEPRLEEMVQKWEDLAFFLYTVAKCLDIAWSEKLAEKTINAETLTQLKSLKDLVNKTDAPVVDPEVNAEITAEEITFKLYSWVQPSDVIAAVNDLQKINPELAKTIIPLLKSGDVLGVQKALGMEEWNVPLYRKADEKFGRNTLENLRNGKVVARGNGGWNGSGNGGWTENGGGDKDKNKEIDVIGPEHITSIDQLPITQTPSPALTKQYHMDMEIFGKKIALIFYPNGIVKLTWPESKELTLKWEKLHDKTLVIDTGLPLNYRYIKFKNQDEFAVACNNAYDSLKQKAKDPEKAKNKSKWTPAEIIIGSLLFAPLVPIVLPAAIATVPVAIATAPIVAPAVWTVMLIDDMFGSKDKNKKPTPKKTSTYDPFDHRQGYGI